MTRKPLWTLGSGRFADFCDARFPLSQIFAKSSRLASLDIVFIHLVSQRWFRNTEMGRRNFLVYITFERVND